MSAFLLPGAIFARLIVRQLLSKRAMPWSHLAYLLIIVLWMEFMGGVLGYWLIFELNPQDFPSVLVNPLFSVLWITAFVLLEDPMLRHLGWVVVEQPPSIKFISNRKQVSMKVSDVVYIESCDTHVNIHDAFGNSYQTKQRIGIWQEQLPAMVRIHRSFLINTDMIQGKHGQEVILAIQSQHVTLPVSRSYRHSLNLE